jgi:hypothetical protein
MQTSLEEYARTENLLYPKLEGWLYFSPSKVAGHKRGYSISVHGR